MVREEILHIMPTGLRGFMKDGLKGAADPEEIRIRIGQAPEVRCANRSIWLPYTITAEDLEEMLTFISGYSVYAYEEEIRQGYLTIAGGNRIGFAGETRLVDGRVDRMTHICFLNIRIAAERKGCAKELLPFLFEEGEFLNTLLIAKPGAGKTTFLRDCVRMLSDGEAGRDGKKVCVIDERSEIAASHLGVPQNDVGRRTDVLDGCPKQEGMRMAMRSMSPEIIGIDELGGKEDAKAVEEMILSGCKILGTMHGSCVEHSMQTAGMKRMYRKKLFARYVLLNKTETGERTFLVYDQDCKRLC